MGPNGAGKSTLLKAIAGITKYSGSVRTCSRPAYMPAYPEVDPLATVEDVISAGLYGIRPDSEHIKKIIKYIGIEPFMGRRFGHLSSGEKRLVCIARALSRKSKLVLLDEPLSFLDVSNQARVLAFLRRYAREIGAQLIVTTHELHYLIFFDELLVLKDGLPSYVGDPKSLHSRLVSRVYEVDVEMLGPGIFIPKLLVEGGPSVR